MTKLKSGDRVLISENPKFSTWNSSEMNYLKGSIQTVDHVRSDYEFTVLDKKNAPSHQGYQWYIATKDATLVKEGDTQMKERRTFKSLKELPEIKKGTLVQEKCDDGTQDYIILNPEENMKYAFENGNKKGVYPRGAIENSPEYYVEVFKVTPEYMTKEELEQWNAFKAGKKTTVKASNKQVLAPTGKKLGNQTKYPWIHTMEVGDVKHIATASKARVNASTWNHSKTTGKKFAFKKLNNYSTEVTRVK